MTLRRPLILRIIYFILLKDTMRGETDDNKNATFFLMVSFLVIGLTLLAYCL